MLRVRAGPLSIFGGSGEKETVFLAFGVVGVEARDEGKLRTVEIGDEGSEMNNSGNEATEVEFWGELGAVLNTSSAGTTDPPLDMAVVGGEAMV